MDREMIEREVRAAVQDWGRSADTVSWRKPHTTVTIMVKGIPNHSRKWVGTGQATCAPEDHYSMWSGHKLALERAMQDVVMQIVQAEHLRKERNDERRREWEAKAKPPMPQMQQRVKVFGAWVWCEDDDAEKIRRIPGVAYLSSHSENGHKWITLDPRYDRAEVIAAIEAVGRE